MFREIENFVRGFAAKPMPQSPPVTVRTITVPTELNLTNKFSCYGISALSNLV